MYLYRFGTGPDSNSCLVNSGLTTPMVVRGDGNCLFNAIFLVLFGHENASSEIRLKTFCELFDNAAFYDINTATPDDIISNRVAQNARYYQHKKDRPEST